MTIALGKLGSQRFAGAGLLPASGAQAAAPG